MVLLGCKLQAQPSVRVVPKLMISQKEHHIGLVVHLINDTENNYIFDEGDSFSTCLKILKQSLLGAWVAVESPAIQQRKEQYLNDLKLDVFSTYKDDYNSDTPLFREWILSDTSNSLSDLNHHNFLLANEVAQTAEFRQLLNCMPYIPDLFFVKAKATYEWFENLDYVLDNPGHYRVAFFSRNIKHKCLFSYKGFQLVSSDIVQFDSVDIWVR